jgi:para-nitrobenzyl esterase
MKQSTLYKSLLICVVAACCSIKLTAQQQPVVKTENGLVQGYAAGELNIFKGIPFAAPPVGDLRWKAPQPVKTWTGVLKCDKFSPSAMQAKPVPFMMWSEEFITPPDKLSEDCLYLNVWAPSKKSKEKLPVFVWIYGGGFSSGSAACAVYDGEEIATKGIVFVSFNYRVGVIGFMSHPELSSESPNKVSGNYGLLDQIAALQWVKKNIEAFSGDPQKVTIAGQSAGSMSVCSLVASPLAKGLFRGAIAQSGGILTNFMNWNYGNAEKAGVSFMQKVKAANIAELRKKSAEELFAAAGGGMGFAPVNDGYVLPVDIFSAFRNGQFNDVTMLAGWVTGDGSLMGTQKMTSEKYKQQNVERFGDKAGEFVKLFPGNNDEEIVASLKKSSMMQFAALPSYLLAEFSKNKVFIYEFSHVPVDKPDFPNYGAFHTSEVPFALNTLHLWKRPWRKVDFDVEKTMNQYWVNFVKTGNPNGEGLPKWTNYDKSAGSIMEIGDQAQLIPGLYKNEFIFLESALSNKK